MYLLISLNKWANKTGKKELFQSNNPFMGWEIWLWNHYITCLRTLREQHDPIYFTQLVSHGYSLRPQVTSCESWAYLWGVRLLLFIKQNNNVILSKQVCLFLRIHNVLSWKPNPIPSAIPIKYFSALGKFKVSDPSIYFISFQNVDAIWVEKSDPEFLCLQCQT